MGKSPNRNEAISACFESVGLTDLLRELSANDVLLTNGDAMAGFVMNGSPLSCMMLAADDGVLSNASLVDAQRILVFCERNERHLVRSLRHLFPGKSVLSGTYDILPRCQMGRPSLNAVTKSLEMEEHPPLLVLASPNSGGNILAELLESSRQASPWSFSTNGLEAWFTSQNDFHVVRYIAALQSTGMQAGKPDLMLDTALLQSLAEGDNRVFRQLGWWLRQSKTYVIHFDMRDKFMQTLVSLVLDAKGMEAADAFKGARMFALEEVVDSFQSFMDCLTTLVKREAAVEVFLLQEEIDFLSMTFEEIVEAPIAVLKSLSKKLSRRLPRQVMMPDIEVQQYIQASLAGPARQMREQFISNYGLELNTAGSYGTLTDRLRQQCQPSPKRIIAGLN